VNKPTPDSVQAWISKASEILAGHELYFGHGTDNPDSEAQWLVIAVLTQQGMKKISQSTAISAATQLLIEKLLRRRVEEKIPMAYLLNEAWFAGHCFYVDERVLVPRSPFAELIDNGFEPLVIDPPETILDLCCGSGCIGIACALAFPDSKVLLTDNSREAIAVADINIQRFELGSRVSTAESDMFKAVSGHFDLIVSNPPYVSRDEYQSLPREYHHEPEAGLVCGHEGLELPLQIFAQASEFLNQNGLLILETGYSWQALEAATPEIHKLWLDFEFGGEGLCAVSANTLSNQA
jgi:ribosomal protein L3 glutamine methyltransferase